MNHDNDLTYWADRAAELSELLRAAYENLRVTTARATESEQRAMTLQQENNLLLATLKVAADKGLVTPDDLPFGGYRSLGWNWQERWQTLANTLFPKRVITNEEAA